MLYKDILSFAECQTAGAHMVVKQRGLLMCMIDTCKYLLSTTYHPHNSKLHITTIDYTTYHPMTINK